LQELAFILSDLSAISQFHRQKTGQKKRPWRGGRTAGQQVSKSASSESAELRAVRMASLAARSFALLPSIYQYAPTEGYILQTPAVGLGAFGEFSPHGRGAVRGLEAGCLGASAGIRLNAGEEFHSEPCGWRYVSILASVFISRERANWVDK
jgi:hypothetical protein